MIKKVIAIYASGFMAGVALIMFPGAGSILTDPAFHGFTGGQFGSIFTPQIITAILSSLLASKLADKISMKNVLLAGLAALFVSMLILGASHWLTENQTAAYVIILISTAFLGAGFGFSITALNPFAYQLFEGKESSAVTGLHFFLGIGTATSPLLISLFAGFSFWWGAPFFAAAVLFLLFIFTTLLPLKLKEALQTKEEKAKPFKVPARLWLYVVAVFFYGACEATFGSWGGVFLEQEGGLSVVKASLGLSLFWGFVAFGRVLFALFALRYSTRLLFMGTPFVLAAVFFFTPLADTEILYLMAMALGGLAISFLFPQSVSASTDEFPQHSAVVSGFMVAALQLGFGFSANLIGFFSEMYSLTALFQFSTVYAILFGGMIVYLLRTGGKVEAKPNPVIA
ncbi:MAG: MFS transporter, partial [Balneolaceae bacterium]